MGYKLDDIKDGDAYIWKSFNDLIDLDPHECHPGKMSAVVVTASMLILNLALKRVQPSYALAVQLEELQDRIEKKLEQKFREME